MEVGLAEIGERRVRSYSTRGWNAEGKAPLSLPERGRLRQASFVRFLRREPRSPVLAHTLFRGLAENIFESRDCSVSDAMVLSPCAF
jgi:hypothetical protein